tara:strand:+ start:183 stop:650 length:468 start_codon:yes stop_codon:yes gene_type:complete
MSLVKSIFFMFLILNCQISKSDDLNKIRKSYLNASLNEDSCKNFMLSLKKVKIEDSPLIEAYKISAELINIKYLKNPFKKFKLFNHYSKKLNLIINKNPLQIEIRFLRYLIQLNSPDFLFYNKNIEEDYNFINKNIFFENKDIQNFIFSIIKKTT